MQLHKMYSQQKRILLKIVLVLAMLLLFGGASTIPFFWETQSLWYKFGTDKLVLRLGQIAGLYAAVLLFVQIVLAVRLPILDRIFGLDKVFYFHHLNAYLIAAFALCHAGLVLIPEGLKNLPIGWKFWPEIAGAAVLFLLLLMIVSARYREKLFPYHRWRTVHRPMGYILLCGAALHIFFVSDSFSHTVPKSTLIMLLSFVAMLVVLVKYANMRSRAAAWRIKKVTALTPQITSLLLTPSSSFSFVAGQFAILRLKGKNISSEPHPFTIASSPDMADIEFIIKHCGDWTRSLSRITSESTPLVSLQGPYGLFSYQAREPRDRLIFIAAGIGITPMLSMLRRIRSEKMQPQVTLIWTMRGRNDMFLETECNQLKRDIPHLEIHCIFTQEHTGRHLDKEELGILLGNTERNSHVYICGPESMMKEIRGILKGMGFPAANIYWERFAL